MPDLPHLSGREIVRALEHLGFAEVRQRGSHVVMKRALERGTVGCIVPMHDEVAIGTLRSILKQAGVAVDDFLGALK
jgi:predicted RNA binding protein YcfA (HicA-like mRNA interferase family)